jgi:hypothetical protein
MKTYTEIEKLAYEVYPTTDMGKLKSNIGFIKGYNQCQEDMADKKYTDEDMIKFANQYSSINILHLKEHLKEFTLNKQDNENKNCK